jgi:hypothetical protein
MTVTIFSRTKDQLSTILNTELVDAGLAQEIRTSRGYDTAATPYVIVSTDGYGQNIRDGANQVDIKISVIAKFSDATEEDAAEVALDEIEQRLIDLFSLDGTYQVNRPYWGAVDRYKRSWRPFSPLGPGYRYSESYLRFTVYDV